MSCTVESEIVTDDQLLSAFARRRDNDAFGQLVHRYVDLVYSTSLRRVRDGHLADDVTQAVFLLLSRKAAQLPPGVVLAGWLYRCARYLSADAIKMNKRRQMYERRAVAAAPASSVDVNIWPQVSPVLETAMDRLSAGDRDVLLLRFFQGLDVNEVGQRTGVPANTASKRIRRALEKLRSHLADRGVHAPADALGAAIISGAIQHAPTAVVTSATAQATAASSAALSLTSTVAAMKVAAALIIAALVAAGVAFYSTRATTPASSPAAAALAAAPMAPAQPAPPSPLPSPTTTAPGAPLEPVSPAQEQEIRAAVYTLEHYQLFVQYNEWPKAIRTLVNIGRPAVPELVALLDRSSNDSTLRAMGFTLRAIGDPRACSALIRAIPRTRVLSSDCGFTIDDKDLSEFMHKYELSHGNDHVSYSRAIRELAGALEAITHHNEGKSYNIDAKDDSDQAGQVAQKKHEQFAQKWQRWWEQHQHEFVSEAELATLTAHPHDAAAVEAVGAAVSGPLFPTGKPYYLGEIHDVHLHTWNEAFDETEVIDFDAARTMTLLQAMRLLPKGMIAGQSKGLGIWYASDGAAADGYCINYVLNAVQENPRSIVMSVPKGVEPQNLYTLYGIDDLIWPVDDGRWDTLESEIESGKPITLGDDGPLSDFEYRDPVTHKRDNQHFPATFLFRTREGGAGIVQLLESEQKTRSVHLRYQMVEPHPKGYQPKAFAAVPQAGPFGPVTEVTLRPAKEGLACGLDLDTGQMLKTPPDDPNDKDHFNWMNQSTGDVFTSQYYKSDKLAGVRLAKMTVVQLSDGVFDTIEPGLAELALSHMGPRNDTILIKNDRSPSTAAFRTRDGTSGIIQVTTIASDPPSVTVRYKLLQKSDRP
jgi:RNA polymerase sigma factor (sigma-70 family)